MRANVFYVQESIDNFGVWYALWMYGVGNLWTIFVATRISKRARRSA